jgi:hypothetical protein
MTDSASQSPQALSRSTNAFESFRRALWPARARLAIARETVADRRRFRRTPPETLNEKIRCKMAFDRDPILKTFADKVAVRQYVADRVGPHVLNEGYAVFDRGSDIDVDRLPQPCVIKPSHGSGAVIISDPAANPDATIPTPSPGTYWPYEKVEVRPERLKEPAFRLLIDRWLAADYANMFGGWCYRGIPRRIIVERRIGDPRRSPIDYKVWCVNGRARLIQVGFDTLGKTRISLHLPDWTPVNATIRYPRPDAVPATPPQLPELLEIAERLAEGSDFLRVDLYVMDTAVLFGELTAYPTGGGAKNSPEAFFTETFKDWHPLRLRHRRRGTNGAPVAA